MLGPTTLVLVSASRSRIWMEKESSMLQSGLLAAHSRSTRSH